MNKLALVSFVPFATLYAEKLAGKPLASIDTLPLFEVTDIKGNVMTLTSDEYAKRTKEEFDTVKTAQRIIVTLQTPEAAEGEEPVEAEVIELVDVPTDYSFDDINRSLSIVHHRAMGNEFKAMFDVNTGALTSFNAEVLVNLVGAAGEEATLDIDGDRLSVVGTDEVTAYELEDIADGELLADEFIRANAIIGAKESMRNMLRGGVSEVVFDGYDDAELETIFNNIKRDFVFIGQDTFVGDQYNVNFVRQQPDQMQMMQGQQGGAIMAIRIMVPYGSFNTVDLFVNQYLAELNA